jgi:hypothetical protein
LKLRRLIGSKVLAEPVLVWLLEEYGGKMKTASFSRDYRFLPVIAIVSSAAGADPIGSKDLKPVSYEGE